ncbi:hypothetical protein M407DRAFT_33708 [Tulasnella calospora MUT 4182]|uniref:Uncharacterized protein n=1 Tax=Tulasnella calospora MUT 4182 TaxID=1051891 RepID=A0A0C3Q1V4_9AGAM|nr:hypothetical protein M407DRAFT_33708 [Tulasnella calospora MUT 4182]
MGKGGVPNEGNRGFAGPERRTAKHGKTTETAKTRKRENNYSIGIGVYIQDTSKTYTNKQLLPWRLTPTAPACAAQALLPTARPPPRPPSRPLRLHPEGSQAQREASASSLPPNQRTTADPLSASTPS